MKHARNLLERLKIMPYFNKNTAYQLGMQFGLKKNTINTYISRYLKRKDLIQLKNGLFVSNFFYNKNKNDISYKYFLANILRKPSYISSWTALQYYNLATEAIYPIISTTTKITRDYRTKIGNFKYQKIKNELFTDFSLIKNKFEFFIATPSKALFDLLYSRTKQFRGYYSLTPGVRTKKIMEQINELRIDIDEMGKNEKMKFNQIIKNYFNE
jgi:predicted transcriptional regulator of viral defense system